MEKMSPYFTASAAAVLFFIIVTILKYLLPLPNTVMDLQSELLGALLGAVGFWIVIFVVHVFLNRRYG